MEAKTTMFAPLQKALKTRIDTPVIATLSLVEAIGNFAGVVKTHYSSTPKNLVPVMAKILESTSILANGAGYEIPDIRTSMKFYGDDRKSMTLRVSTQKLIGDAATLLTSPEQGPVVLNQINSNIMSICDAHDINFKDLLDYAVKSNKKK